MLPLTRDYHYSHRGGNYFRPRNVVIFILVVFFTLYLLSYKKVDSSYETGQTSNLFSKYNKDSTTYRFAIIADRDKRSKNQEKGHWESKLRKGTLLRDPGTNTYTVSFDEREDILALKISEEGRGMELSDLVNFNHKLLSFDDRTGLVLSIEGDTVIPQGILMDGNGQTNKGFKCEWSTVKDGVLVVGSTGKEWTRDGVVLNNNPQWVKHIDVDGKITHVDWSTPYKIIRKAAGAQEPGYLIHEAVRWSPQLQSWFFLPRRHSTESYDDVLDEQRGTNMVIRASEDFHDVQVYRVGTLTPSRGFSGFAFIPGREQEVVAIKSEEFKERIASYITVFNIVTGEVLMPETEIETEKYEGIEILM